MRNPLEANVEQRTARRELRQRRTQARAVDRLLELRLQRLRGIARPRDRAEAIGFGSELLDLRTPDSLDADPNAILRAFLLMAQHRELRGMSAQSCIAGYNESRRTKSLVGIQNESML